MGSETTIIAISEALQNTQAIIFALIVAFLLFLFRDPISDFIKKMTTLSYKKMDGTNTTEFTAKTSSDEKSETNEYKKTDDGASSPTIHSAELLNELEQGDLPNDKVELTKSQAIFSALEEKDFQKAAELNEDIKRTKLTPSEKQKIEAWFLYSSFTFGDETALLKLKNLTQNQEAFPYAFDRLGASYMYVDNYAEAVKAYENVIREATIHKATTEDDLLSALSGSAHSLFQLGKKAEAYSKLEWGINKISSQNTLSKLYQRLASLYDLGGETGLRILALEMAIQNDPNDVDLRFNIAHAYYQDDIPHMTLLHYSIILKFNREHPSALNNIGATYDQLKMPLTSVQYYREAMALGETLSMANLAYQFMDGGFEVEASDLINKANEQEYVHENIGLAKVDLQKRKEHEAKIQKESTDLAKKQHIFIDSLANARFEQIVNRSDFSGEWLISDESIGMVKITNRDSQIKFEWTTKVKYKWDGQIVGRAVTLTTYKETYNWANKRTEFEKDGHGFAILPASMNPEVLQIMIVKNNKFSFLSGTRMKTTSPPQK